ncbi:protoheme IX farnesyltransferase [Fomitopsis betulina]|nr:protoheme IX farnesyltransferase [Fomitopsis betulina]
MRLPPSLAYVCRDCARRPLRQSSTLAARPPAFTSFFFHNSRWSPPTVDLAQYPPPPSVSPYRRTTVLTPTRLLKVYSELSKTRLTVLVVLTAMSGVPLDAQMARTRMRPLVRRAITPLHAAAFATATGLAGPAILWTMCNPTTALLGAANIALYAGLYTSLKRKSIANTWVGSVVGGIPPLMGWTACGGNLLPSADVHLFLSSATVDLAMLDNPLAPWALFLILYSWQFPHFNAISYLVRESYAVAGYRMLCVLSPAKNALVSLRHALLLIPICSVLVPLSGLTTWAFAVVSLVPNVLCARVAWQFWKNTSEKNAKKLWHYYLAYLPAVLGLMMVCKRGLNWFGEEEEAVSR